MNTYFLASRSSLKTSINRLLLSILPLTLSLNLNGQTIDAGLDQSICVGECADLSATYVGGGVPVDYSITDIAFAPDPAAGTTVTLTDDSQTALLPIGFDFCFYGNTYSDFVICSNNWIGFSAGETSTWETIPIPAAVDAPKNCIMGPWHDINPGIGGTIYYQVLGTAPNRRLVVTYENVPMFSCDGMLFTSQIVIYETSNIIENHISAKPICASWNSGNAVQGLHNIDGTAAVVYPGRNNTAWDVTDHAIRYTPNGTPTVEWYDGVTLIGTGTDITVCPGATKTYTVNLVSCGTIVATDDVTVTVNPLPTIDAGLDQEICAGETVTLTGSGAGVGGTYSWSGGATDGIPFSPGATATYTVTGTDANGCVNTDDITVTVNPLPTVTATATPTEICEDETLVLTGGGADTYTWDGGATDGVAFTPPVGTTTYTVTGTNTATGCQNTAIVDVTVNPLPIVTAAADFTEVCVGDLVTLTGAGADTYTWDGGVTDGVAFAPPIGTTTYTVTGTNAATGCQNTATIDITVFDNPTVTATATPDEICIGESITFTGGGADTYTWGGGITDGVPFTPVASGTYTYTVTGSVGASGCEGTATVDITVHDLPIVTATATPTEICEDETLVLTGGGADTYTWDGGATDGVAFTPPIGTTTYTVTGTNTATGCQNTAIVDVTVNPLPIVTAAADFTEVCVGDLVTLTGAGADTYTWDGGVTDGVAFAPPLGTTTYTVTGTNAATGCQNTATIDITVFDNPTVTATATPDEICIGESITFTGGGADTYTWDGGITDGVPFTPVASGTYTYTVTGSIGASGCEGTATVDITVHDLPTVTATATPTEICEDETLVLTGGGADTYTWDGGATDGVAFTPPVGTTTYTVTGTSVEGCTNTATVDVTVNPLPIVTAAADFTEVCVGDLVTLTGAGADTYTWDGGVTDGVAFAPPIGTTTYTVTGTNAATGCQNTATIDITVFDNPTVTATATPDEICIGESITFTGGGADTYTWDGGITDGVPFTPAASGTYTYTVTGSVGASGCEGTATVDITVHDLPTVTATATPTEICEDETLVLNGGGADTYTWDGGATDGVAFTPPVGMTTYTVTGTSVEGCTNTATVDVTVNPLPIVTAAADFTEVCVGDLVTLTGAGADTYTWDGGVTDGVAFTPPIGTTTYTVTGTNAATGCQNTATIDITVFDNPTVIATATPDEICIGESIIFTGGGADTYTWDGGITDGVPFTPAASGTYTYTVTGSVGASGCEGTATVDITVHDLPTVTATATPTEICEDETLVLTGGGADTYTWDGGATDGVAFTPPVGTTTYTVTGTSAEGCSNTTTVDVTVNPLPIVTASVSETEICLGESITLTGSGADTYSWDSGVTDGVPFTPETAGTLVFTVTGTSIEGCTSTATIEVDVIECEEVIADFIFNNNICVGDCIEFTDNSTGTIESWSWDFGGAASPSTSDDQNPFVCFSGTGTFDIQLTVTNIYGITSTTTESITINEIPSITALNDTIIDVGGSAILVGNTTSSGEFYWTPEYKLDCSDCQITEARPKESTTYTIHFIDENGCQTSDTVLVLVNYSKGIGVPTAFSPNADGNNDVLYVKGYGITGMNFRVFNRYGEMVFESDDQNIGWDGTFKNKDENPGVFTWVLVFNFQDGKGGILKGNTTLIR